jgi:hypothetical protein
MKKPLAIRAALVKESHRRSMLLLLEKATGDPCDPRSLLLFRDFVMQAGTWNTASQYASQSELLCYNGFLPSPSALDGSRRGVAQPGRAPGSGPGGRRFKSSLPDHLFSATYCHLEKIETDRLGFGPGALAS